MKIGKPVKSPSMIVLGKYRAVWDAAAKLKSDEWLPVEFDTKEEAYRLYMACRTHRSKNLEARTRKKVCYIKFLGPRGAKV